MNEAGDRFVALLNEHKGILQRIAGAYSRTASDREDLTQEIVAQLWRSFPRYDPTLRFSTWMYRVALNTAISFTRQETRRTRHVVSAEDVILESGAPLSEPDPRAEQARLLASMIAELGDLDRALMLLYLDGKRHSEIAEVLGISESNVGTKIGRIKQRMRADLAARN